jgi:4-azaleucine resistance transporter AzlC
MIQAQEQALEGVASVAPQGITRRSEFWAGLVATLPLVLGAIPFGIIFGAVAVASGLSAWATVAMSALVFAGASQFIAVGLVASGAAIAIIVLTTFVVNLRHALYAASLAPHMKELPQRWLAPLGFWLTDESFVVVIERYNRMDASPWKHWYFLGSAIVMYVNWNVCTWIGIVAGRSIPNIESWGLEFAISVTFIGMLMPMLRRRSIVVSVVVAGSAALIFADLPNNLGLIVAALMGVALGMATRRFDAHATDEQRAP